MSSSRLPGKVMLPLDCDHVLEHDVRRVSSADRVDEVVVATSEEKKDDIIERYAELEGTHVYRGSEDDVLDKYFYVPHLCHHTVWLNKRKRENGSTLCLTNSGRSPEVSQDRGSVRV